MKRKKLSLEPISGLLTIFTPRMEDATKRQMLSLIFLVMATILEYIRGLLTVLTPKIDNATKRQMLSLTALAMATLFTMTPFASAVSAQPTQLIVNKTVTGVNGQLGENVTKMGDIISYNINVTNNNETVPVDNVTITDPSFGLNNVTDFDGGQSRIYTGNYTVTQEDINNNGTGTGLIINIANATYSFEEDSYYSNDSANVTIIQDPSYTINKTVIGVTDPEGNATGGNVTAAGDVIAYLINVTNDGNIDLTNVTVNDTLIGLTGPVQSNSNATNSNNTILQVGENWNYTGNYTVTQEDINSNGTGTGFINNTAIVTGSYTVTQIDTSNNNTTIFSLEQLGPQNSSVQTPIIQDPSYTINKTVTNVTNVAGEGTCGNVTAVGDVIAYQVVVTNDGNIDLNNVTVNDTLIGLTGPVQSNSNATNSNDTILQVGENWNYTGNYTITQEDINSNGTGTGFINNTAIVTGNYTVTQIDTNNNNTTTFSLEQLGPQNSSVQTPIKRVSDYSIFKSVIAPDEDGDCIVNSAGDEVPYRIVVKNDGNVDLTGVSVSDPMIELTGPTGDDTDPGVLNLGEVWVYTGIYTLTPDDINNGNGYIDNIATVSSNELPDETSNVSQPVDQNADLSIQKSVIGIDEAGDYMINQPGDVINYQIAVKNNGDVDLTGISVDDPMITLTGPTGDSINPGVLNTGETWVYTGDYEVTQEDIDGSGFIENTATVSCNELSEESSSTVLPIIPIPPIIIAPEPESKVLPIANFNANPMSGYAPLAVQFTDYSQNAASRSWDFNNDGIADSSEVSPVHTYTAPGTYTANLTVSNANGTNSKTAPITVLQVTSNSGGSSGGSSHSSGKSSGAAIVNSSAVSDKTNATGTVIQPENNTPAPEQNTETTAANIEQTPEKKTDTSTPAKESKRTPGFEIISGIVGLLSLIHI